VIRIDFFHFFLCVVLCWCVVGVGLFFFGGVVFFFFFLAWRHGGVSPSGHAAAPASEVGGEALARPQHIASSAADRAWAEECCDGRFQVLSNGSQSGGSDSAPSQRMLARWTSSARPRAVRAAFPRYDSQPHYTEVDGLSHTTSTSPTNGRPGRSIVTLPNERAEGMPRGGLTLSPQDGSAPVGRRGHRVIARTIRSFRAARSKHTIAAGYTYDRTSSWSAPCLRVST